MAMSIPESVKIKIERTDQHISDVDGAIAEFWKTQPYKVIGYIDAGKRPTYQVTDTKPIDPMIPAIAGDAIQCLRAALDRMACALWSRTNAGDCKIYFPIADSPTKFKSEALRKVNGLGQDAIDAITEIEPYQGGKGETLWCLHRLSIIDRHRLPLTVIGGQMGVDLIPLYRDRIPELAKSFAFVHNVANFKVPLEKGDILFIDEPGAELHKNLDVSWLVFFNEPRVLERKRVDASLKSMRDFVNDNLNKLAVLL